MVLKSSLDSGPRFISGPESDYGGGGPLHVKNELKHALARFLLQKIFCFAMDFEMLMV